MLGHQGLRGLHRVRTGGERGGCSPQGRGKGAGSAFCRCQCCCMVFSPDSQEVARRDAVVRRGAVAPQPAHTNARPPALTVACPQLAPTRGHRRSPERLPSAEKQPCFRMAFPAAARTHPAAPAATSRALAARLGATSWQQTRCDPTHRCDDGARVKLYLRIYTQSDWKPPISNPPPLPPEGRRLGPQTGAASPSPGVRQAEARRQRGQGGWGRVRPA